MSGLPSNRPPASLAPPTRAGSVPGTTMVSNTAVAASPKNNAMITPAVHVYSAVQAVTPMITAVEQRGVAVGPAAKQQQQQQHLGTATIDTRASTAATTASPSSWVGLPQASAAVANGNANNTNTNSPIVSLTQQHVLYRPAPSHPNPLGPSPVHQTPVAAAPLARNPQPRQYQSFAPARRAAIQPRAIAQTPHHPTPLATAPDPSAAPAAPINYTIDVEGAGPAASAGSVPAAQRVANFGVDSPPASSAVASTAGVTSAGIPARYHFWGNPPSVGGSSATQTEEPIIGNQGAPVVASHMGKVAPQEQPSVPPQPAHTGVSPVDLIKNRDDVEMASDVAPVSASVAAPAVDAAAVVGEQQVADKNAISEQTYEVGERKEEAVGKTPTLPVLTYRKRLLPPGYLVRYRSSKMPKAAEGSSPGTASLGSGAAGAGGADGGELAAVAGGDVSVPMFPRFHNRWLLTNDQVAEDLSELKLLLGSFGKQPRPESSDIKSCLASRMMAEQPASADNKTDITDSTNNNSSTKPASSDQGSQRLNISPVVGQTGAAASISGETPHGAPGAATTGAGSISVANATVGGAAASGTPGASGWKGKTPAVPKQALMVPSPQEGAVSGGSGNIGIKGEVSGMGVDAENDVAAARMEGNSREVDGMDIGVHDGVVPNDSTRKDSTVVKRDSTDATSKIATVSNNVTVSGEANVGGAKAGPVGEQDSKAVGARVPIDVGIVIAAASGNDAEEPMEVDRQLLIESETKREALQLQEVMVVERTAERRKSLLKERNRGAEVIKYLQHLERQDRERTTLLRAKGQMLADVARMIPERQEEIYILKQELAFLKGKSGIADPNDAEDSIRQGFVGKGKSRAAKPTHVSGKGDSSGDEDSSERAEEKQPSTSDCHDDVHSSAGAAMLRSWETMGERVLASKVVVRTLAVEEEAKAAPFTITEESLAASALAGREDDGRMTTRHRANLRATAAQLRAGRKGDSADVDSEDEDPDASDQEESDSFESSDSGESVGGDSRLPARGYGGRFKSRRAREKNGSRSRSSAKKRKAGSGAERRDRSGGAAKRASNAISKIAIMRKRMKASASNLDWPSRVLPRTPYGVPLLLSCLSTYPDRVAGAFYPIPVTTNHLHLNGTTASSVHGQRQEEGMVTADWEWEEEAGCGWGVAAGVSSALLPELTKAEMLRQAALQDRARCEQSESVARLYTEASKTVAEPSRQGPSKLKGAFRVQRQMEERERWRKEIQDLKDAITKATPAPMQTSPAVPKEDTAESLPTEITSKTLSAELASKSVPTDRTDGKGKASTTAKGKDAKFGRRGATLATRGYQKEASAIPAAGAGRGSGNESSSPRSIATPTPVMSSAPLPSPRSLPRAAKPTSMSSMSISAPGGTSAPGSNGSGAGWVGGAKGGRGELSSPAEAVGGRKGRSGKAGTRPPDSVVVTRRPSTRGADSKAR